MFTGIIEELGTVESLQPARRRAPEIRCATVIGAT